MAYCTVNFFSKELESYVDLIVLYPTPHNADIISMPYEEVYRRKTPKTLYLLHGALDDYTSWLRGSGVERYAEAHGVCVVMPSGQNAFYTNMPGGLRYFDFITKELPAFVEATFGVSDKREDRFIAGLSMGGYGAMKAALTLSDRYAAVGSFSGAIDLMGVEKVLKMIGSKTINFDLIFGGADKIPGSEHDIYELVRRYKAGGQPMDIYVACGSEDAFVIDGNKKLDALLSELGVKHTYETSPGIHDWDFWDPHLRRFFDWLKENGHID